MQVDLLLFFSRKGDELKTLACVAQESVTAKFKWRSILTYFCTFFKVLQLTTYTVAVFQDICIVGSFHRSLHTTRQNNWMTDQTTVRAWMRDIIGMESTERSLTRLTLLCCLYFVEPGMCCLCLLSLCLSVSHSPQWLWLQTCQTIVMTSIMLISCWKSQRRTDKNHVQCGIHTHTLKMSHITLLPVLLLAPFKTLLFMQKRRCFQMMSLTVPANFAHVAAKSHLTDSLSLVWISQVNRQHVCERESWRDTERERKGERV